MGRMDQKDHPVFPQIFLFIHDNTLSHIHFTSQLATMAASYHPETEQTWYADSWATNHITHDLNNLSLWSSYHGNNKAAIGNGQGLKITHIGSPVLHTPFKFTKMLHVPDISSNLLSWDGYTNTRSFDLSVYFQGFNHKNKEEIGLFSSNLLSINQFAKDNSCVFIFYLNGFKIKDQRSGRILFQGLSRNGLYPFPFSASPPPPNTNGPIAFLGERTSIDTWHKHLGHPSSASLRLLTSLPVQGASTIPFCEFCKLAKKL